MLTGYFHHTRKRLSTYIFDIMKLKILYLLYCEFTKYIAKLFPYVFNGTLSGKRPVGF